MGLWPIGCNRPRPLREEGVLAVSYCWPGGGDKRLGVEGAT